MSGRRPHGEVRVKGKTYIYNAAGHAGSWYVAFWLKGTFQGYQQDWPFRGTIHARTITGAIKAFKEKVK